MRIFIFGNNKVCLKIIKYLKNQKNTTLCGICLHESKRQKYVAEILNEIGKDTLVIKENNLSDADILNKILQLKCDIAFSIYFGYILKREIINIFPQGIINVHPAFLPFNRGSAPNVFSIIDNTPAGATIHYIDEGIDTGKIIIQKKLKVKSIDTGKSLYLRLEKLCENLFVKIYPCINAGKVKTKERAKIKGTFHNHRELKMLDEINMDKIYKAEDLINLIRARTFSPHSSAFFFDKYEKKVFVKIKLSYEK